MYARDDDTRTHRHTMHQTMSAAVSENKSNERSGGVGGGGAEGGREGWREERVLPCLQLLPICRHALSEIQYAHS